MTSRAGFHVITIALILVVSACLPGCHSNKVQNTQADTTSSYLRPSTRWQNWLSSTEAKFVDAKLKGLLARFRNSWHGRIAEPFEIVRSFAKAPREKYLVCGHFEKQHALGRAADVRVVDLNGDTRVDVTDLCLFASQLKNESGATAVYGWQNPTHRELWVHIDCSGEQDHFGEWREGKSDANIAAQPIFWSNKEASPTERIRSTRIPSAPWRVVVDKKPLALVFDQRTGQVTHHPALHLYANRNLVKSYPVALGFDPFNDKQKRDDYRTPEGEFYLCGFNAQSRFHKSLRLSYPNEEDATRGLSANLIDEPTYRKIVKAVKRRRMPPQDTKLGGDIMLHGGGGKRENWTWGCIALDNAGIDELFALLPYGTPIKVLPAR